MIDRVMVRVGAVVDRVRLERTADIFRAVADPARLQTLLILAEKERNVSELAEIEGDKLGTVSARLKVLLQARLLKRRREGRTVIYTIADDHVLHLIENAVAHACETTEPEG